jgi:glycosyltransferase involved in cell wall biosynthesis
MSDAPEIIHLDLEPGWRGGQRQLHLLIGALAVRGWRQSLICRRGSPWPQRCPADVPVTEVANRRHALRVLPRPRWGRIVHAHTGNTIPLAVWAGRSPARSVITRRVIWRPRPFLLRRADAVVAISDAVEHVLHGVGLPASRVRRIPSAIDRTRRPDPAMRASLRGPLGISDDAVLGLTVAALAPEKDPLTLVAALADMPRNYVHVWVGDGPLRGEVEAAARSGGVAAKLHLTGFLADPDPWFAAADLYVMTSVAEGLNTTLLDAMHFGLPLVGTNIAGSAELLRANRTALVFPPADAAGLAAAVGQLLADPAATAGRATEAARLVESYDIEHTADQYDRLYRHLLA